MPRPYRAPPLKPFVRTEVLTTRQKCKGRHKADPYAIFSYFISTIFPLPV